MPKIFEKYAGPDVLALLKRLMKLRFKSLKEPLKAVLKRKLGSFTVAKVTLNLLRWILVPGLNIMVST